MASRNTHLVRNPLERQEGQKGSPQAKNLLAVGEPIHHVNTRVVTNERQRRASEVEGAGVHPATVARGKLGDAVSRPQVAGDPRRLLRPLAVHFGHVRHEDATLEVAAAGGDQRIVRVPVQAEGGGAELLLDVLGHPEALRLFEVADANAAVSTADRKLFFFESVIVCFYLI